MSGIDITECEASDARSDCPKCGEWRDSPYADCAGCGYIPVRPCGDPSGRCLYTGPHDGPHKVAIR